MVYEHSETVQRHQHSMNESVTDQRTKGLGQVLVMLTHLKKNQVAENFRKFQAQIWKNLIFINISLTVL